MFNPPQLKYKKEHRHSFKNKEYSLKKTQLVLGTYGIASKIKVNLTYKQIEAVRKVLTKSTKGIGLVFTKVKPNRPISKKKGGMRMGKGKGDVGFWVVHIPAGHILFEVTGNIPLNSFKEIFKEISNKLPMPVKLLVKGSPKFY